MGAIFRGTLLRSSALRPVFRGGAFDTSFGDGPKANAFSPATLFAASEQGVWYDPSDFSTMYQDSAGTIPVTAVGQPVGFLGDKSKGFALGADVIVNGNFATDTVWGKDSAWTISGGVANYAGATSNQIYTPASTLVVGALYEVTFDVASVTTAGNLPVISSNAVSINITSIGTYTARVFASADGRLRFGSGSGSTWRGSIDNVVCRQILGNHAVQPTAASRPVLGRVPFGGRRNLLTFTEQFDNAAWANSRISISQINPGEWNIVPNTVSEYHFTQQGVAVTSGKGFFLSIEAKPSGYGFLRIFREIVGIGFDVNLTALTASSHPEWVVSAITLLSDGFVRIEAEYIGVRTQTAVAFQPMPSALGTTTFVGDGTSGVILRKPQKEFGTFTDYQRVVTALDVTEAGVADNYYLQFDGVDDFLSTANIDFSATDEMTVVAGVQMLTNATTNCLVELSPTIASNPGAFAMFSPDGSVKRLWLNGGGSLTTATQAVTAPVTSVDTGLWDISASPEVALRVNGAQVGTGTGTATGNFGAAYPLFIGRRGGTTLPFNGHLFSLVIRGKTTAGADLTNVEAFVAGKTGVTLP